MDGHIDNLDILFLVDTHSCYYPYIHRMLLVVHSPTSNLDPLSYISRRNDHRRIGSRLL